MKKSIIERVKTLRNSSPYKRLLCIMWCFVSFNLMIQAQTWYTLKDADVTVDAGVITKCNTSSINWGTNNIIIPETLNGQTIIGIKNDDNGVFNGKGIDSLELPVTLKRIGHYEIYGNHLTRIKIPENVSYIGNGSFSSNLLISLELPNSVDSIGNNAFKKNSLKSITIPDGIIYIGSYAFFENFISTLTMGNSVIKIDNSAFSENPITNLTLSNNLTYIGNSAFSLCNLGSLTIPASVTYIGTYAFMYNSIRSLTLPNSITTISNSAFSGNNLSSITIPNSVTKIGDYAFSENDLSSLIIPSGVSLIGDYAFWSNNLSSVTIPGNVTSIGDYAFSENQIKTLSLSTGIKFIGNFAFYKNVIENLVIPSSSVDSIGDYAFSENALTTLVISDNLAYIGDYAFSKNTLKEITLPNIINHMGMAAFNNNAIVSVNGVSSRGLIYGRKSGIEDKTKIVSYGGPSDNINFIPIEVVSIGDYSFANSKIKTLKIPFGVTFIGNSTFYYNSITSLTVPSSIDTIGQNAFYYNQMQKLTFDTLSNVRFIGSYAFAHNRLTSLAIPNSVASIGENAFYANELSGVTFRANSSVTSIGNKAFGYNSYLTEILLPIPVINEGYSFSEWKNSNNISVTKISDFDISYTAKFSVATNYKASGAINIDRPNGLHIAISGDFNQTVQTNTDGSFGFLLNTGRNVTIEPKREGYTFSPEKINISNIQANISGLNFASTINTYNLSFIANGNGTITGQSSQVVEYGKTTSEITANANNGYKFLEWQNSAHEQFSINNPIVFTVHGNETLTAIFAPNVGIENNKMAEIRCYPNPTMDNITIESLISVNQIEIYNIKGEKVYALFNNTKNKVILSVAKYPKGIYFVHLASGNLTQTIKVLIE